MCKSLGKVRIPVLFLFLLALIILPVEGQVQSNGFLGDRNPTHPPRVLPKGDWPGEYTFVRIIYDSPDPPFNEYNRWFGGAWRVDYPDADENFMMGIREWAGSNLRLAAQPVQLRATDEHLFDYPFCYIVEPGHMELTDE